MPGHYVFVRCWVGFTDAFPFEEFNCLPDSQIVDAIESYALDWLRKNKAAAREEIRRRKTEKMGLLAALERRARHALPGGPARRSVGFSGHGGTTSSIWRPGIGLVPLDQPYSRKRRPRPSLGVRVAQLVGWAHVRSESFGNPSPSSRIFATTSVEDRGDAEQIARALQMRHGDSGLGKQLVLRFGVVPASDLSPAEQLNAELFVENIRAGESVDADENIENIARLIVPDAAEFEAKLKKIRARAETIGNGSDKHSREPDGDATGDSPPPEDPDAKKLAPSRVKAAAVYEWGINTIDDADNMILRDLHHAILEKLDDFVGAAHLGAGELEKLQELRDSLPHDPDTFRKYLNEVGIKRYNTQGERIRRISHFKRRNDI